MMILNRVKGTLSVLGPLFVLTLGALPVRAAITWTGAVDGNWDNTTTNWTGPGGPTNFTDDGSVDVVFNGSGGTITISSNMSPKSTTVSAASGTYIFTGGPIDTGFLDKSGGGTLQLERPNTFPGGFTLNGGKVACAHMVTVFGTGTITLNGGELTGIGNASASYTNAVVITGGFKKGHNAGLTFSGPLTLNGSYTITNLRNKIIFQGQIDDGGNGYGMTFDSPRTDANIYLSSGANTYSGKTIIKASSVAGLLKNEGEPSGFGNPTGTNAIIDLHDRVKLFIYSGSFSDRILNLVGDGSNVTVDVAVNSNGGGTIGSFTATGTGSKILKILGTGNSNPGRMTVSGPIPDVSDGSQLTLQVPFSSGHVGNYLTLNGTNTFTGPLAIGAVGKTGRFKIGGAGQLGGGSYTNTISIDSANCIFDYASSAPQSLSGQISGIGTLETSGTGVLVLSAVSNSVANVTLSSYGTLQIGDGTGDATLVVTNNINVPNAATNNTLALDISGGAILVDVAGSLVYAGAHTSYLKIIGGGQETPIITYGGTVTNFDYVVYNGKTNTWLEAQSQGALTGQGGRTQLRIAGNDIYIDPLPPSGTVLIVR